MPELAQAAAGTSRHSPTRRDQALPGKSLRVEPALLGWRNPVDAWSPTAKGVSDAEGVLVMPRVRYGETRADRVAGAQQGAEVGVIGNPERSHDEVVPAAVSSLPALCPQFVGLGLGAAHRRVVGPPEAIT